MQYENLLAGAYQVEKTLDRSTYSVLCVGKQAETRQAVRLRFWLTARVTSPEEQQRIQAEVAAIQQIKHAHLLPILEVRATERGVILVSASAQKGTLNTRLSQNFLKPLPQAEALMIVKQVGLALHALHQHGITHGNLTPLAIFFSESERVCLGEFHLRSILENIQGYQPLLDENIPRCWYMAPEQFNGQLNAQTDQYALGCLAYVLLTGRVPFAGSARATLLQKHQNEQPRALTTLNPDVPEYVETAVLKALAKEPAERHNSVLEFLQELREDVSEPVLVLAEQEVALNTLVLDQAEITSSPSGAQPEADGVTPGESELAAHPEFAELATLKQPALNAAFAQTGSAGLSEIGPIARGQSRVPKPDSGKITRKQAVTVLGSMIAVVLVIVLALSGWLVWSGGRTPTQILLGATPGSTQAALATATATGNLQPTTASTVQPIGLHYPTPTAGSHSTPTAGATPDPAPVIGTVTPQVTCVKNLGNGNWSAEFGYTNSGNTTVTIPQGSNNILFSSNGSASPPTQFAPGSHNDVVQIVFSGRHGFATWTIKGVSKTANSNSPQC